LADDMTTAAEMPLVSSLGQRSVPPLLRAVAFGPVLSWQGDMFGTTVNLASRLVNVAHPGTILVSEAAATQLQNDGLQLKPIRGVKMKGIEREGSPCCGARESLRTTALARWRTATRVRSWTVPCADAGPASFSMSD
jgi:hypothetical protein